MPGLPVNWHSQSLLKLMSIESVMPSNHFVLCRPLLLLPSVPPSIRVFSNESVLCIRWPKYWSFSFNISPSSEYPGLISFRMDWLDLLSVQGTLKSLLQSHSSKASILLCTAFFIVQLSHPYMTTGKTTALTRRTLNCTYAYIPLFWISFSCRLWLMIVWHLLLYHHHQSQKSPVFFSCRLTIFKYAVCFIHPIIIFLFSNCPK